MTTVLSSMPSLSTPALSCNRPNRGKRCRCCCTRQLVVRYSVPTSNHNQQSAIVLDGLLYLIRFLHQTTTDTHQHITQVSCILFGSYIKPQLLSSACNCSVGCILFGSYIKPQHVCTAIIRLVGCILFGSYIKPQQLYEFPVDQEVVSYSVPTSNHNTSNMIPVEIPLYLIRFLHQTTTYCKYLSYYQLDILSFADKKWLIDADL